MAFAAVTILMDTLHQHFLQPTPRFPLRNKTKLKSLYKNLSSLQTCVEQDFKVGECDEAMKALEAQIRDVSVELRFQIEHHLALFYLGKSMKLRLESAQKLLPILNRAIEELDIETMDFKCMLEILEKHFTLPVSCMPAHIKKRVISFCKHPCFFYVWNRDELEKQETDEEEEETGDQQESDDEEKSDEKEMRNMLCEAENIIRQELRAPSYLTKYMKQRIEARQRIRQLFIQGIKLTSYLKKEVLKVKNNAYNQSKTPQENITAGDSLQHSSESTINMVGCDDEFNAIMDKLNQQSEEREIVSIVGMGGIGKTTLARRIYGDASFISRFDCRAWVTISQAYNPTKVFKALLRFLVPEENNEASNNELGEQVYKCLKRQRYLIIIDDIWSTDVWSDLQKCFPDDNYGSRILLTTRLKNVADYAGSGTNFCHTMRFLDSYESWKLFRNKVLRERITLSPEFEGIGRKIVNKCKGLPLAISVVAGLLSNSKQDLNEWELIAKNVHTLSLDHSNQQCGNIIDLSYTFLPHHLKHCFLSLGCFLEDEELPEDYIVDLWVGEGFLKVLRSKRLEDVARESLQDLVDRNLLSFREMNGGLSKEYQIHDVLRELALREAQKENLLCFHNDFKFSFGFRRIQPWSIQSKICSYNSLSHPCNTLLALNLYWYPYTNQFHFHSKFLRGLILGKPKYANGIIGYMCTEFTRLVHLRYMRSNCCLKLNSLPLFMLWNLQKLEVGDDSMDELLNIWGLPQLKNLSIKGVIKLVPPKSVCHNLELIEFLDYRSCKKELFVKIPNLRTLGVSIDCRIDLICKSPNWFESLVYLYKLEELKIQYKRCRLEFRTIHSMGMRLENFLPNLKKLKLVATYIEWKDMDVVGMLPKLEVLIISKRAVASRKWESKDGGFLHLKFLGICYCELECWEATSGDFPVLECLLLGRNWSLQKIPSGFADIITLRSIKLFGCSNSIISSAKGIQEEQQEYGNNTFAVDILGDEDFDDDFWGYEWHVRNYYD